jgi:hypothetical protein
MGDEDEGEGKGDGQEQGERCVGSPDLLCSRTDCLAELAGKEKAVVDVDSSEDEEEDPAEDDSEDEYTPKKRKTAVRTTTKGEKSGRKSKEHGKLEVLKSLPVEILIEVRPSFLLLSSVPLPFPPLAPTIDIAADSPHSS